MTNKRRPLSQEIADFEHDAWTLMKQQLRKLRKLARENQEEILDPNKMASLKNLLQAYENMRREIRESTKESQKLLKQLSDADLDLISSTYTGVTPRDPSTKGNKPWKNKTKVVVPKEEDDAQGEDNDE